MVVKTTLIWAIFNKLMETGGELTYFHLVGADANDFHTVVVWQGKIITICSIGDKADPESGDEWKYIKDGIQLALDKKTEILLNVFSDECNTGKEKYTEILLEMKVDNPFKCFYLDKQDSVEKQIKKQINFKLIFDELRK